jgi:sugar phosphate isomerase/epimerase
MTTKNPHSRRDFIAQMAAACAGTMVLDSNPVFAESYPIAKFSIAGFTKPFQHLGFEETADLVAQVGWDGIECPLRRGGQILPEKVEEDLPRMVQALKQRNLEIYCLATDIRNATDPLTERVLRTAAKLGIKLYRLASLHYDPARPIPEQIENIRADLRGLVALNAELGLRAAFENHSGNDYVGAPIWDIYDLVKGFDPQNLGICFDIAHASIEGGLDWPINFHLIEHYVSAVYVKDFLWKKARDHWDVEWCPLGQGMIDARFFQKLLTSTVRGPIVQHIEYPVGAGRELVPALKRDRETLQTWLTRAGDPTRPAVSR